MALIYKLIELTSLGLHSYYVSQMSAPATNKRFRGEKGQNSKQLTVQNKVKLKK